MQGYSHALTGAAGWLLISTDVSLDLGGLPGPFEGAIPLGVNLVGAAPEVALIGAAITAGAALAPDADHHSATIAHSLPPVTGLICDGVGSISGGHRHGTHSFLGIAALGLLAWLASLITMDTNGRTVAVGAGIFAVLMTAFALKGLGINLGKSGSILRTHLGPWIVSLATAGAATYFLDYTWSWLPFAIALGALIHCLGDALTVQGVPWLWPWNPAPPKLLLGLPVVGAVTKIVWQHNGYFRFPILGETSSAREVVFAALVAAYVLATFSVIGLTSW